MYFHAHAGLGWILAEAGRGDARFRRAVFLAALAPDVDALTHLLGLSVSLNHHHVWTHNMVFSLIVSVLSVACCANMRLRVFLFTQLAFYAHYFGDYFFTTWPLSFFFPFSRRAFLARGAFHLWHPVNDWLGTGFLFLALMVCVICRRTPLEVISPRADKTLVDLVRHFLHRAASEESCPREGNSNKV